MTSPSLKSLKWLFAFLYGLLVIWTGLLRGIEAHAYKPNSLWFCTVMGGLAIAAAFLYRTHRPKAGAVMAILSAAIVLAYYLTSFITQPEGDATVRVGRAIVASVAMLVIVLMPSRES